MAAVKKRLKRFNVTLESFCGLAVAEVCRLGILREGVQLTTTEIRLPIYGQVIPRIELEIRDGSYEKKVTVRINQDSRFMFDGATLTAQINGDIETVPCRQYVDPDRAPTGMYNFGTMRENGLRSFVFDYHTYCCYACDFCFKENEWEVLSITYPEAN